MLCSAIAAHTRVQPVDKQLHAGTTGGTLHASEHASDTLHISLILKAARLHHESRQPEPFVCELT